MTIHATYDGEVLRPDKPLALARGARVRLTVDEPTLEADEPEASEEIELGEPYSFFRVLESLQFEGPPDWAENLDDYLTGKRKHPDE